MSGTGMAATGVAAIATTRFDELRIKTDQQLIHVINHAVALGIGEARRALYSAGGWAVAEDHYRRAQRIHFEAALLIPLAGKIGEEERRWWESKLEQLGEMLDGLAILEAAAMRTAVPDQAVNDISALARALWKARGCPEGTAEDDWFSAEKALHLQARVHAA